MQKIRWPALSSAQPNGRGFNRLVTAVGIAVTIVAAPFSFKGKNLLLDHAVLKPNRAHAQAEDDFSAEALFEQMKSDKISELNYSFGQYEYTYEHGSRTYKGWHLSADEWGIHAMARTCIDHVNGTRCVDSECKKRKRVRVCDAWGHRSALDIKYGNISEVTHESGTRLITIHMKNGRTLPFRVKYNPYGVSYEYYLSIPQSEYAANLAATIRDTVHTLTDKGLRDMIDAMKKASGQD